MRKHLTLTLMLAICLTSFSQVPIRERKLLTNPMTHEYTKPLRDLPAFTQPVNPYVTEQREIEEESVVGVTWYDAMTNAFVANNLVVFRDATMEASWTYGIQATTFPDRGTGYNYFDGSTWGPAPAARVENSRTGWGHASVLGQSGEIIVAHDASNLEMCKRDLKGSGAWSQFDYPGVGEPSWPRQVCSGDNNEYLHLIYHTYGEYAGMPEGAMIYSRSSDGGQSWDPADMIIDGTGPDYYYSIQGETYALTSRGNTVAILVGGEWNDMFILKSEDNGENWDKIMIWEHPYPFFDWETTIVDTLFAMDNSADIAIDPDGKCHVVFGITRVMHESVGTTFSTFPFVDGIGYWNEDMPAFSDDLNALAPPQYGYPASEMVEDYNYIGWTQDMDGDGEISLVTTSTGFPMSYDSHGLSTMPTIHIDDDGKIYVVWASTTETYDNFEWNYKKLWERRSYDGVWSDHFEHLTQDITHIFDESIFPTIAEVSDDDFYYLLYQADGTPGTALNGDHDYQENRIFAAKIPKGVSAVDDKETHAGIRLENRPNPFSGQTLVSAELPRAASVSYCVTDQYGKLVMANDLGFREKGMCQFTLGRQGLAPGLYFLILNVDNQKFTHKLIIV